MFTKLSISRFLSSDSSSDDSLVTSSGADAKSFNGIPCLGNSILILVNENFEKKSMTNTIMITIDIVDSPIDPKMLNFHDNDRFSKCIFSNLSRCSNVKFRRYSGGGASIMLIS